MFIGQVFAYRRPYNSYEIKIDDLPNFFYATNKPGGKLPLLDSGINKIASIKVSGEERTPLIMISSSPHKIGSDETPWQDFFDPDNGHIRYFGDNKTPGKNPELAQGNKRLLEAFDIHNSHDFSIRQHSVPILFFRRVTYKGKLKGNVMFQGFGIVERAERVTQFHAKSGEYFSNYVFDFAVFSMKNESEKFNWEWINKRRDPNISSLESLSFSPYSWKKWIKEGPISLEKYRRRVSKLLTTKAEKQKPVKGSREMRALEEIYAFYDGKKARFEGLAAVIAKEILGPSYGSYLEGWITPASSDGGSDFVGRINIGTGFANTKLVVLGQAKCEKIDTPTNGNHIARTVARLRRGWIGVYVTTSYFSEAVQREIIEDGYPIVMVHGLRLAEEVLKLIIKQGSKSIRDFLEEIDSKYDSKVHSRKPEEILFL